MELKRRKRIKINKKREYKVCETPKSEKLNDSKMSSDETKHTKNDSTMITEAPITDFDSSSVEKKDSTLLDRSTEKTFQATEDSTTSCGMALSLPSTLLPSITMNNSATFSQPNSTVAWGGGG